MSILSDLKVGKTGIVQRLDLPDSVQNHLMHMGFVPDAQVTVLRRAPAGDPTVYAIDGLEIAIRRETASAIHVGEPQASSMTPNAELHPQAATTESAVAVSESGSIPVSMHPAVELAEVAQ